MVSEYKKLFEKLDYTSDLLPRGDYENCQFKACNFSNAILSDQKFFACEFIDCNLSLARVDRALFRDVQFRNCKMLGLLFDKCSEHGLSAEFENCNLTHSSFYGRKLKATRFNDCQLVEVDFTDCDLSGSLFRKCDLGNARFENTNLEKVDLRQSFNFTIDPELNRIRKARFSLTELPGLLGKYQIEVEQ